MKHEREGEIFSEFQNPSVTEVLEFRKPINKNNTVEDVLTALD